MCTGTTASASAIALQPGTNLVTVTATDTPGNTASTSIEVFYSTSSQSILLAGLKTDGSVQYTTDMASWKQAPGYLSQLSMGDLYGDGRYDLAGLSSTGSTWRTTDLKSWTQIPGNLAYMFGPSNR